MFNFILNQCFISQGLELLSRLYPSEISQNVSDIQQLVITFISFDPYFVGDGDGDEAMEDASDFEYDFSLFVYGSDMQG